MSKRLALVVGLFLCTLTALAQSPVFGLPGTPGSQVFWPAQVGSPVFGLSQLPAHVISAWPMNEGHGSVLFDLNVATADNLVLSGGTPTWGVHSGFPGSTLQLPVSGAGTSALIAPTNLSGSTPFTIALWEMETTSALSFPNIFLDTSVGLSSAGTQFRRGGLNDDLFEIVFGGPYPTNTAFIQAQSPNGILQPNILYYLVATYDGSLSSAGFKMYINGVLQNSTILTGTLASPVSTTHPAVVGMQDTIGTVAFVETYNIALSAGQIAANYTKGPGIY